MVSASGPLQALAASKRHSTALQAKGFPTPGRRIEIRCVNGKVGKVCKWPGWENQVAGMPCNTTGLKI